MRINIVIDSHRLRALIMSNSDIAMVEVKYKV